MIDDDTAISQTHCWYPFRELSMKHNDEDRSLMLKEITLFDQSRDQRYGDFLDPMLVSWLDGAEVASDD